MIKPIFWIQMSSCSLNAMIRFHIEKSEYVHFQMVIERSNLREDEKGSGSVEEEQMYYMQLAQLVIVVALILAVSVSSLSLLPIWLQQVLFFILHFTFTCFILILTFIFILIPIWLLSLSWFRLSVLLCIHSGVSRVRRQVCFESHPLSLIISEARMLLGVNLKYSYNL